LITWYFGVPSSSSHALVGGLIGSSVLAAGIEVVKVPGLLTILIALLISPVMGLMVGFALMRVILLLARRANPSINNVFKRLQIVTLIGLGLSHGTNDAQKTMGVIALGLVLSGRQATFSVPMWVIAASALAIALGTSLGGWRLIRTLGGRIYRIRPVHGFASQVAGASVILTAALLGGPVSTTQVLSTSIVGAGAAERINKIRWNVMGEMVVAWLLTIPISAGLSALCYLAISTIR
jgi:PiT family inorganic phosphate transporter